MVHQSHAGTGEPKAFLLRRNGLSVVTSLMARSGSAFGRVRGTEFFSSFSACPGGRGVRPTDRMNATSTHPLWKTSPGYCPCSQSTSPPLGSQAAPGDSSRKRKTPNGEETMASSYEGRKRMKENTGAGPETTNTVPRSLRSARSGESTALNGRTRRSVRR